MLEKLKAVLTWQVVALFLGGGAIFAVIAIFAPEDTRMALFGANGLFCTFLAWLMRSPLVASAVSSNLAKDASKPDEKS